MKRNHSIPVYWRAFRIWQNLGYLPWNRPKEKKHKKKKGDFFKGAFDSIPFLNDDAKRTFSHLLLRPGYMIRDYIRGDHERYLAPLTALIIFYAFFALVSAVLQPVQHESRAKKTLDEMVTAGQKVNLEMNDIDVTPSDSLSRRQVEGILRNTIELVRTGYIYLHLDQFPEEVDTQHESSIAAFENTMRSQGIPLFLGKFFVLWLALGMALRRYKVGMAACATISAYVLCQFSFFMLFVVLFTWGQSTSIGVLLMGALLAYDFKQLLGISIKKSIRRAIAVGIDYALVYLMIITLVSILVVAAAYFKQ